MTQGPNIRKILHQTGLAPHKTLGQNFLTSAVTADRIAELAGITTDDTIIELGVGLGSLTLPLARRAKQVLGIELDAGIVRYHEEEQDLPENVILIHQDLLTADYKALAAQCGGRLKIAANLPYSVSSPLLFLLLDHRAYVDWAILMVQKEVADRLIAAPNSKQYGILSVLFGACGEIKKIMQVGPGNFHPQPKVDSTVIRITFGGNARQSLSDSRFRRLKKIVKAAFGQRRKTLLNSLAASGIFPEGKPEIEMLLEKCGISGGKRAENLTVVDFLALAGEDTESDLAATEYK